MPRTARLIASPDQAYHLMTRGNNRWRVFHDDEDHEKYSDMLMEYSEATKVKIFHYSLMPNHVHLEASAPDGDMLAKFMKFLNQGYSLQHRRKYGRTGHLWEGRYKSKVITTDEYLLTCGIYIELNPVRAGLCERPEDYPWSSYRAYAFGAKNDIVTEDPLFIGLAASNEARRAAYRALAKAWMSVPKSLKRDSPFLTEKGLSP